MNGNIHTLLISLIVFMAANLGLLLAAGPSSGSKPQYSTTLESALRTELFTTNSYEVLQRPSQRVDVQISLTILTVNDLNIKDQALSISGYLSVIWSDSRLNWTDTSSTSQDYGNVPFLFSTEQYVWRPALIIENSIVDIGVINDKAIPMRIKSDGTVIWNPSGIYEVSCESDTTYYPLDSQECSLKISSWAYTNGEVGLTFQHDPVDLSFYSANGEWDLTSATGSRSEDKSRGGISFSSLSYSIKLQRRPMFHVINTLLPVALMAVLIAMVFKLPVDSGEKIGFSLTVLLAYAVYLTMISDNIPSTSVTVCYLSIYLVFILSLGVISVCLTILVLSLHFRSEDKKIPKWIKSLTQSCLTRIACMSDDDLCTCVKGRKVDGTQMNDTTIVHKINLNEKGDIKGERDNEDEELTWQQLSVIMDHVFFNVYMAMIVVVTVVLFLMIFIAYYNS